MDKTKLELILEAHKEYLKTGNINKKADLQRADLQRANLQRANLRYADLQRANLRYADLQDADLRGANLRDANLDFSVFPLWCGSFNIKNGDRIVKQLLSHIARIGVKDKQLKKWIKKIPKKYANNICNRHTIEEV